MAAPSTLPEPGADDVLWLLDLSNYLFRAYHALPPMNNAAGEPTQATLGTMNMLRRLVGDHRPSHLAIAMDSKGRGFRGELFPDYKAHRPKAPADFKVQLERTKELCRAYRIPLYGQEHYEADDIIATCVRWGRSQGMRVVIASSDKDLMQLVEPDGVWCWDAMRNRVYGVDEVHKKFGVKPERIRDLLALIGDSSDNIPGIRGVGPKTAAKLLNEYGDIAGLLAQLETVKRPKLRDSLIAGRKDIELAYELVGLREDAKLEIDRAALRYGDHDTEQLRAIFTELQFSRMLDALDAETGQSPREATNEAPAPGSHQEQAQELENWEHQLILGEDELRAFCGRIEKSGRLAVVAFGPRVEATEDRPLTGLALCADTETSYYLPLDHRYLGAPKQLPLASVRSILGPLLADSRIAKLGHDLKESRVLLAQHGLALEGLSFDTMLGSYLLDPEASNRLNTVCERVLQRPLTAIDSLTPPRRKGQPKQDINDFDVLQVAPLACDRAHAILRLSSHLEERIHVLQMTELNTQLELPLLAILSNMEERGVLVDCGPLKTLAEEMAADLSSLEEKAHALAGHGFNLASPKQLETILFDELGLTSVKKTRTGRSTNHEALEAIENDHALPGIVLEHRGVAKLKGTYVDALPRLIHPKSGRIHSRWEQAVAATGRLSSRDPNMQNIPIRSAYGKRIREAFVAPQGKILLSADYSQIELRVLAHLSQDPKLVEAFNNNQDVHVRTAMEIFGVAADEVSQTMRAQSKTVNFGVIYGMGPVALSKRLRISRKQAKSFIDAYFERYSGVTRFMQETLDEAKKEGSVSTILGRRRLLPDLQSSNRMRRAYAERIAQNTPIQGSAADILKLAMLKLEEPVVAGARMVLTVHDELVFEVPIESAEEARGKTKHIMESVQQLRVPLLVEAGLGPTWADAH